ncbi:endonuclease III domain-containing protein [Candidatus Marsarchaeota archaeon]|jgi:endonuclease-3 related protein|nr:endonuclease III domain-containing protein [Candidatus Marsarchaeota archaeon]
MDSVNGIHGTIPTPLMIYEMLEDRFGFQGWWPGRNNFEILVGAMLTQQTSWKNVDMALLNLRKGGLLSLDALAGADLHELEIMIKPSGYYRQKAARLKAVCNHIRDKHSTLRRFLNRDVQTLRVELLSLSGIGEETADSIILYAADKPVFVIDAYTKRMVERLFGIWENLKYDALQDYFQSKIVKDVGLYKDFHAQIVELGKRHCRAKPLCGNCPLFTVCRYGKFGWRPDR